MAEQSLPRAKSADLPRIGELIDKETGVKYDSYSPTQKKLGLEAAMAAIVENPDYRQPTTGAAMKDVVYTQFKKQAELRMSAVEQDLEAVLGGQKLGGLNSSYLMVQMTKPDAPGITDDDRAKLGKAAVATQDPGWRVAEGASNVTNFARDMLFTANGASLNDEQRTAIRDAVGAARQAEKALVEGTPVSKQEGAALMAKLDRGMDAAEQAAGDALRQNPSYKANYAHFREAMREGITGGLEAIEQAKSLEQMKGTTLQQGGNAPLFAPAPAASKEQGR